MRSLLQLPDELGAFQRIRVEPLAPASGKAGEAAAYLGDSFSAVVAVWQFPNRNVAHEDGVGPLVAKQFEADLAYVADTDATCAPMRRLTLLIGQAVAFPMLEARYLVDGVDDEPAFATFAAFGVLGSYVSVATTIAGDNVRRTSNQRRFYAELARTWRSVLNLSPAAMLVGAHNYSQTDFEVWSEIQTIGTCR